MARRVGKVFGTLRKASRLQESVVSTREISPIGATRVRTLITVQWIYMVELALSAPVLSKKIQ